MLEIFRKSAFLAALFVFAASATLKAQNRLATPIVLSVDATHAPQKILHAHMEIPVPQGPLTLLYPKWIPGEHQPSGPIINVAGMRFSALGNPIAWRRDSIEPFALHLDVPPGVVKIDADLDFLLSAPASGYSAGASATAFLDVLSWNQVVLYPQGIPAHNITVVARVTFPPGWKLATALPLAKDGDGGTFDPVPLDTLIDSPVIAGRYFRAIQLTPGEKPSHEVDIAADSAAALAMTPDTEMQLHRLVAETGALFGSRHYRDYHFLLTLSDDVAHFGLEHHESSDDRVEADSLITDNGRIRFADLLPHEFVHSWNGKYRRPEGLLSPDYLQPMKDDLLWVYEGLTEYLGEVLSARSGLRTQEMAREQLALVAASYENHPGRYENRPGREWRPLQDTATAAVFLYDAGSDWSNWRRGVDFYDEGQLLWLDVDSTIRRLTNDQKSINDFCRAFHGGPGGEPALKTYSFEDVVAGLNSIAPFDWTAFLRKRLDAVVRDTPTEAVENSGWKLVYNERPNDFQQSIETARKRADLIFSIGMVVGNDGSISDVLYDGPSYKAGIGPGMKITAVNGQKFTGESLKDAIDAAKSNTMPIELIIANGAEVRTYSVDYHGGARYPHLERNNGVPDFLTEINQPLTH